MPLRLLHISDIHFHGYGPGWNDDHDQQIELLKDVRHLVAESGVIDAILIGGDIAFAAARHEYDEASRWIDDLLLAAGGLQRGQVWTVPGNHDVDRALVDSSMISLDFRRGVCECSLDSVDWQLRRRLSVDPLADNVMKPFDGYNDFASQFGCQTTAAQPHWNDDTLQLDDWTVRLTGINSAIASHRERDPAADGPRLVIGKHQCELERRPALVHVVMMHHPPEWIRDWKSIEPLLRRGHVWVFGHEHAFGSHQDAQGGTVEVFAGAVSPERVESGETAPYVPSYDLITLSKVDHNSLGVNRPEFCS